MPSQTGADIEGETGHVDTKTMSARSEAQAGDTQIVLEIDPKDEKKVLAKLDIFLTPILFIVYLSCFIDRANIGKHVRSRSEFWN